MQLAILFFFIAHTCSFLELDLVPWSEDVPMQTDNWVIAVSSPHSLASKTYLHSFLLSMVTQEARSCACFKFMPISRDSLNSRHLKLVGILGEGILHFLVRTVSAAHSDRNPLPNITNINGM